MSETNIQRSTRTQASIIQAVIRLAKDKSLDKVTVRDICSEAGVSIGSFYHHFSSRQELFHNAFLIFDATLEDQLPHNDDPPLVAAKEVLMIQTGFIVNEAGPLITEYYKNILSDSNHSAVSPQRKYYRSVLYHLRRAADEGLLKEGFSPEYITELLIKFVRGCIIDWCLHDCDYDVVGLASKELDLMISMVSKPAGSC